MSQETTSHTYTPAQRPKPQPALSLSGGRWLMWLGLAVISVDIALIAMRFASLRSQQAAYEALSVGLSTQGRVVDKRITVFPDRDVQSGTTTDVTTYIFTYQYEVDATQFTGESTVADRAAYDQIRIGDSIDIRYAANNPALVCLHGYCPPAPGVGRGRVLDPVQLIGVVILLIGLMFLWIGWRLRQKMRRLASHGQTAPASILDRWIQEDSDGEGIKTTRYCITYQFDFSGPSGENQRMIRSEYNKPAYDRWAIGAQASVRYLPTDSQICILDV